MKSRCATSAGATRSLGVYSQHRFTYPCRRPRGSRARAMPATCISSEIMHRPVRERSEPDVVAPAINCGIWLAFAVACQWVSELEYDFCPGGGSDMLGFHMRNDLAGLQIKAATTAQLARAVHSFEEERLQGEPGPVVPLQRDPCGGLRRHERVRRPRPVSVARLYARGGGCCLRLDSRRVHRGVP